MAKFSLKDSSEYYLTLSEQPKRFDADSPVTNVFFDDTNGEVFTVRSGGVTGVTVTGMDETKSTSFRMEDRGPIISIKFSPDHKILAIQRNLENLNATVEFVNFKDLAPTNVEYTHTCKWKNAKILGFVWPKANEIAFITDHGIELLQVLPEKKQLKSLKNTSFSGAWYSWCARSDIVLLAGNNGVLLQPFSLSNSSITKLQKLELEWSGPAVERDVFLLRLRGAAWCAVFRHAPAAASSDQPAEVWLMPISTSGLPTAQYTHVLKTGLVGRFAVNVVDELLCVHHQSSQTSLLFDIAEESKPESNTVIHLPVLAGCSMRPAYVDDMLCPMYSVNWVVFQPDYIVDARLGCLWRLHLILDGLVHSVSKEEIPKVIAVLLRRAGGKETVLAALRQLVGSARLHLAELTRAFHEVNKLYREWADEEVARNTAGRAGSAAAAAGAGGAGCVLSQADICHYVLQDHCNDDCIVQVVTAYISSLQQFSLVVQHPVAELTVRTFVTGGAIGRLRSFVRRGCLGSARTLACQLWSLGNLDRAFTQLGLDMMWRLKAFNVSTVSIIISPVRVLSVRRGCLGSARTLACQLWSLGNLDRAFTQLGLDMMWRLKAFNVSTVSIIISPVRVLSVRRGCLGSARTLACQLWSLGNLDRAFTQLGLDMMWRLKAFNVSTVSIIISPVRVLSVRRGCLGSARTLACQLWSLGNLDRAFTQLGLDMMWRLKAFNVSTVSIIISPVRVLSVRRGCLGSARTLACQLWSLGNLDRAFTQLGLDMMWRLKAFNVSTVSIIISPVRVLSVRRGCLGSARTLACQLWSLGNLDRAFTQLGLDMMWRLKAFNVSTVSIIISPVRVLLVRRGCLGSVRTLACQLWSLGNLDRAFTQLGLDMMWRLKAFNVSTVSIIISPVRVLSVRRGCLGSARTLACQLWSLGNLDRAFTQLGLDMMWRLKAFNVSTVSIIISPVRVLSVRRGCLGSARTLACQLWSLGNLDRAFTQLGLDMMWRLKAFNEVIVFINWDEPVTAIGVARQAGPKLWSTMSPRRFLEPARLHARERGKVGQFVAVYHALRERNDKLRGAPEFLKGEHCEQYDEFYKEVTSE